MTNPSWVKNLRDVAPYTAGEQPKISNLIKLNTNENPYGPGAGVRAAVAKENVDNLRLYPNADSVNLRDALAKKYGLTPDGVFVGNGSDDVLALSFLAFFNSEKPLLFPDITYSFYPVWCRLFRIPFETVPLADDFTVTPGVFNRENGGVVFPNPNAPTGLLVSLEFIHDVLAHNPDSIVVIDEAYIDFGGTSAIPLLAQFDNLVIVQTFSKSRALAGARIGFALGNPRVIAALNDVKNSFNSYPVDTVTQRVALASVEDDEYFTLMCKKIEVTRENFKRELSRMGFIVPDSKANFVFTRHPDIPAAQLFADLRAAGIVVRHWDAPRIGEYLRVSIGTDEQMDRVVEFLTTYVKNMGA